MIKAHRKAKVMRRVSRVFLNDLNQGKAEIIHQFLHTCHDATQYFVDLFWQRQDFSAQMADLATVHRGRDRFGLTTRLAQALAKQAKETIRSQMERDIKRKPRLRSWIVTLYYHFVDIQGFKGKHFDLAVELIGSGAPRLILPVHSTRHLNRKLNEGWQMSKTLRLGMKNGQVFVEFILEKQRPQPKTAGQIVGMDSNYVNGLVFSDGQQVGKEIVERVRSFHKREKHTHTDIIDRWGQVLKRIDWSNIKLLCIENLKYVKHNRRGTFSRQHNRRLSHWQYDSIVHLLEQYCEEHGVRLERKNPAYTSQYCHQCGKWDRRNRVADQFKCVHCGYPDQSDGNAALNLALLGAAGVYGLRSLKSPECQSFG